MGGRPKQDYSKGKIYKVTNTENPKVYVGSLAYDNLNKRLHDHFYEAKRDKKLTNKFFKDVRELGNDKFSIELIESYSCGHDSICKNKECLKRLKAREGYWIEKNDSIKNGYNTQGSHGLAFGNNEERCEYKKQWGQEIVKCPNCDYKGQRHNIKRHMMIHIEKIKPIKIKPVIIKKL